jgi:hypothetical protein
MGRTCRRQEARDGRQVTGDGRQKTGNAIHDIRDTSHETVGRMMLKIRSGRQDVGDR